MSMYPSLGYPFRWQFVWGENHPALKAYWLPRMGTKSSECAWVLRRVWPSAAPWTVAARLFCPWGFSRQEYWTGFPCPPPGDLPNPGTEPRTPSLQGGFFTVRATREAWAPCSTALSNSNRIRGLEVQRKGTPVLNGHVSLTTPLDELAKCTVC